MDWKLKIKRICVVDFDGTLVQTPAKPEGWKGGWWGRAESMLPPFMPHHKKIKEEGMHLLDKKVYTEYQKAMEDPNAFVVMMTGRHQGIAWAVRNILEAYGIVPDADPQKQRAIFISGSGKHGTLHAKLAHLRDMIVEFPEVDTIEMWEDRAEHILAFRQYGESLKGVTLWVHEPPLWD